MTRKEREVLLHLIDEAYNRVAWHGPTLRGSLRGVSAAEAAKRPAPGRHSIWELAVHAAYWKYAVWRRLTGSKRGTFPRKGSNWLAVPSPASPAAWKRDGSARGVPPGPARRGGKTRQVDAAPPPTYRGDLASRRLPRGTDPVRKAHNPKHVAMGGS